MVVDEYTLLSWAQNPYYAHLTSLEPIRKALSVQGCCDKTAFSKTAFYDVSNSSKLYDDMQFMRNTLGLEVMTVRVASTRMTVSA